MRGQVGDALRGNVQKDNLANQFVLDIGIKNPMSVLPQDINPKYLLHSRRELPEDMIVTSAQTSEIFLDPSVPNVLNENGNTPIPRAGIFKYILSNNK